MFKGPPVDWNKWRAEVFGVDVNLGPEHTLQEDSEWPEEFSQEFGQVT